MLDLSSKCGSRRHLRRESRNHFHRIDRIEFAQGRIGPAVAANEKNEFAAMTVEEAEFSRKTHHERQTLPAVAAGG